ncbi:MAG: dTMP kinase [Deltaproteobacteria bacterium]|nr:dTMP kinase [Deltaproteobacteria bacterium]
MAEARKRGFFITFEGGDGVGKTTQIKLLAKALKNEGHRVFVTREPGGTPTGEVLRKLFKTQNMSPVTELMVLEASRAELCENVLKPRLQKGEIILCDRFAESSLVYQGAVRGLPLKMVGAANQIATQGLKADFIILLDATTKDFASRLKTKSKKDRLDQAGMSFHEKVRKAFRKLAKADRRFRAYSANLDRQEIHAQILKDVQKVLKRHA